MATNGHANGAESTTGVGTERINTEIITLTRFLTEEQTKHKEATGDFTYVFEPRSRSRSRKEG
jgi:fructose-1,6-bisphosphatase I